MRIAIIRGSSLNKWEMQNYEPLQIKHEILAIGSLHPAYHTSGIKLPIKKLLCLGNVLNYVPFGIKWLYRTMGDVMYLVGLERVVAGFDIVHTAETATYYSLQAVKAKDRGFVNKVVVTVWETIPFLGDDNPERYKNKREVQKKADLFLAATEAAKKALLKEGVDARKVKVCPMGVDTNVFKPMHKNQDLAKRLGILTDKKIILFVGRLVYEKGIYDLAEALNLLKNRLDYMVLLIGSGPEYQNLTKKMKDLELTPRVFFIKQVPYQEMAEVMNLADVLVLPSIKTKVWEEQFGMVLIEAMACGKAVIVTEGVTKEIVGVRGGIVNAQDPVMLAKALYALLSNKQRLKIAGAYGRTRVKRIFSAAAVSKRLEEIYNDLMVFK